MVFGPWPTEKMTDEIFNYTQNSFLSNIVTYIINSNYRDAINLRNWINDMDLSPLTLIQSEIQDYDSYDEQATACLRWVQANITYISDKKSWKITERWQTVTETLEKRKGDCEDGAILLYCLCRLKGIPANRLLLMAGTVEGGGHCWLAYKPQRYPLDFVFLDWCYWYNANDVGNRPFYEVNDRFIYDSTDLVAEPCKYQLLWFAFNEDISYDSLTWRGS